MKLSYRRVNKVLTKNNKLPSEKAMLLRAEKKAAKRAELAAKSMLTFITMCHARAQLLHINSHIGSKEQSTNERRAKKALAMTNLTIHTADAIAKIWSK